MHAVTKTPTFRVALLACLMAFGLSLPLAAQPSRAEYEEVPTVWAPKADVEAAKKEDLDRAKKDEVSHFALALPVEISPYADRFQDGWQRIGQDQARFRLRVGSRGALSISLQIAPFWMPEGGRLTLYSEDGRTVLGPFTAADNESHGQLWTPPIVGEEVLLELVVPMESSSSPDLKVVAVHHGYAGFGEPDPKAGPCHVDVSCEEAQVWGDEIRSVGLVTVGGVRFCSGFLINNTREDGRPLFMTAAHCGVTEENAASVVVFWKHESRECRDGAAEADLAEPAGELRHVQTGSRLLASMPVSDAVLLELDDMPKPEFGAYYAGWDRSQANPLRATVIHHPNTDAKRISFDSSRSWTTDYLEDEGPGNRSHIRIGDWEAGSTQGGSSGGPLFNQNRHVVGQLHGGFASCANEEADWFGRFSHSWTGNGLLGGRLSDHLDPLEKGVLSLDGRDSTELLQPE